MMNYSAFSRRRFLRTTAATAAGISVVPFNYSYARQKKKPNSKVNGVQLGLTTYSYLRIPHSLEEVLGYVLEAGVNAVEMRRVLEEGLGIPDGPPRRPRGENVTEQEMKELLREVPEWSVENRDGINQLERVYRFRNFVQAMAFTNQVGEIAEQVGHHPALLTEWGRVTVTWWSHKIKGLHVNDFIMAARTDNLYPAD